MIAGQTLRYYGYGKEHFTQGEIYIIKDVIEGDVYVYNDLGQATNIGHAAIGFYVLYDGYVPKNTPVEDVVNTPSHYTHGPVETIEAIEAWDLGFHLGNCVKYISRAEHKDNKLQDLKKAQWYLNRYIKRLEDEA